MSAWSLFYYLAEREHESLFDYIYNLSLRVDNKTYSAKQRLKEFEAYFADISIIERRWRNYMKDLRFYAPRQVNR